MINYSILINTCDKFEDCWDPFFKLWSLYWEDKSTTIYLNTEYKDYSYPGLNIIAVKGCEKNKVPKTERATWSQCLKWALDEMDTDVFLYLQEDYFFNKEANLNVLNSFYDLMMSHPDIPCIQLTNQSIPAKKPSKYDHLYLSDPDYFSYVCCQASFWRTDVMQDLVRGYESAWNFEWWGSKRAKYFGYKFLVVDPAFIERLGTQITPYLFTGVIGGKWYKPVVDLFKTHDIQMDFSKRGFYEPDEKPTLSKRIKTKIGIWNVKSILEVWKLRLKRS